jgi:hypothetical protein
MMKTKWFLVSAPLLLVTCAFACNSDLPGGLSRPVKHDLPEGTVGEDPDGDDDPTNDGTPSESSGEENTFEHPEGLSGETRDPFEVLAERQAEGAPEVRTRLHSCQKMQNASLRRTLEAFGVDLGATGDPAPAGQLFSEGLAALGGANYVGRTGEAVTWTNSGATKFQDIWVMAAPEIIANLPTVEHCQIDGVGPEMFDADDHCNEAAVTCLIGRPATEEHVAICDQIVASALDIDEGKRIAVATLLAAAHTCE